MDINSDSRLRRNLVEDRLNSLKIPSAFFPLHAALRRNTGNQPIGKAEKSVATRIAYAMARRFDSMDGFKHAGGYFDHGFSLHPYR